MSENRMRRVAEQIKKDVSQIIREQLKDPRIGMLTSVTDVELSKDLKYASIYVSIYGDEKEKEDTYAALLRATGYVRTEIGRRIRLRYTPEINFHLDSSMEYGAHIERVLKTLKEEEKNDNRSDEDS